MCNKNKLFKILSDVTVEMAFAIRSLETHIFKYPSKPMQVWNKYHWPENCHKLVVSPGGFIDTEFAPESYLLVQLQWFW